MQLPFTEGQRIELADYPRLFESLWDRLERRFFKLERAQVYSEPGDPSYEAFLRGDLHEVERYFEERIRGELRFLNDIVRKNLSYTRVRAVERPLTNYLLYEFKTYRVSARYGQRILVTDITEAGNQRLYQACDFMVFDSFAVVTLEYNARGEFQAAVLIEEPASIEKYQRLASEFIERSVLLGVFEREHGLN